MLNHTSEMIAAQYGEYLRELDRTGRYYELDEPRLPLRRRTAHRLRSVADAIDPGES